MLGLSEHQQFILLTFWVYEKIFGFFSGIWCAMLTLPTGLGASVPNPKKTKALSERAHFLTLKANCEKKSALYLLSGTYMTSIFPLSAGS